MITDIKFLTDDFTIQTLDYKTKNQVSIFISRIIAIETWLQYSF